jgi:hypothetical protein
MLARDLSIALDPCRLMKVTGLSPDPWQRELLRTNSKRQLLLCSRQSGKSTSTAVVALHHALYRDEALVLLLSPSLRQSQELFRKVTRVYRGIRHAPPGVHETSLLLDLANGSRIVSLPGKEETVRGYSGVTLLVIDEAARVPDELYYATRPMLAVSSGRLICLSTPFGKRGFFFQEWTEGKNWQRITIAADECPRITADFLEEERRALGPHWFGQEYMCEFLESSHQVFSHDLIASALAEDISPLFPDRRSA